MKINFTDQLDKTIVMNFKMVSEEIGIVCILGAGLALTSLSYVFTFLIWILVAVLVVYFYKIYKKLLYTSVYGDSAAVYQALPISEGNSVIAKVTVLLAAEVLFTLAYIITISIISTSYFAAPGSLSSFLMTLVFNLDEETAVNVNLTLFLPISLLSTYMLIIARGLLVFTAVTSYHSITGGHKSLGLKIAAIAAAAAVIYLFFDLRDLLPASTAENNLMAVNIAQLAVYVILSFIFFKVSVKNLKENYLYA